MALNLFRIFSRIKINFLFIQRRLHSRAGNIGSAFCCLRCTCDVFVTRFNSDQSRLLQLFKTWPLMQIRCTCTSLSLCREYKYFVKTEKVVLEMNGTAMVKHHSIMLIYPNGKYLCFHFHLPFSFRFRVWKKKMSFEQRRTTKNAIQIWANCWVFLMFVFSSLKRKFIKTLSYYLVYRAPNILNRIKCCAEI